MASPTTAGPKARRPGRPRADGTDPRERLLDAALLSFADRGIAATSLRGLARDNGVTPAMLNYYFGSKERLVDAVIAERLLPVVAELKDRLVPSETDDGVALITAFVRCLHEMVARHPWLPALWVREVLTEGGQLRPVFIERIAPELPLPLARRFADAQANGQANPALHPRLLFVSLIGLIMVPFAAAPVWRPAFAAADVSSEQLLAHTLTLLTQGIGT